MFELKPPLVHQRLHYPGPGTALTFFSFSEQSDTDPRSRAKRLSFSRGCPDFQSSTKGLIAPDAVIKAPCSRHRARVGIAAFSSRGSRFSIAACFLFAIASTEDRTPAAGSIRRSYPSASHEYPPALRKSLGNSPDYHWQSLKAENHRLR
nr:hypothetical protein Iba_chr01eCG4070 [Ipomoea batatas]